MSEHPVAQYVTSTEWDTLVSQKDTLRDMCIQFGLPASHRSIIWRVLLETEETAGIESWDGPLDLVNQRVVHLDCIRTRQTHPHFQDPVNQYNLERILTFYCKQQNIAYVQGLNEILAPFFLLAPQLSIGQCYNTFSAFISRFLPHTFADHEFTRLQCTFRLFRLLLLYHDPELCHTLDQYGMVPELYAMPWFLTLFAHRHSPQLVFGLWDAYVLADHPALHGWVALAFLTAHRQAIMQVHHHHLPEQLGSLRIHHLEQVQKLVDVATWFKQATPRSWTEWWCHVAGFKFGDANSIASLPAILEELENWVVLPLSAPNVIGIHQSTLTHQPETLNWEFDVFDALSEESDDSIISFPSSDDGTECSFVLLKQSWSDLSFQDDLSYVLVDCRSKALFDMGHAPGSIHADPNMLMEIEALDAWLQTTEYFRDQAICLIGQANEEPLETAFEQMSCVYEVEATPSSPVTMKLWSNPFKSLARRKRLPVKRHGPTTTTLFALQLLKCHFKYVGIVQGGFQAIHDQYKTLGIPLEDHDAETCDLCKSPPVISTTNRWFKSISQKMKRHSQTVKLMSESEWLGQFEDPQKTFSNVTWSKLPFLRLFHGTDEDYMRMLVIATHHLFIFQIIEDSIVKLVRVLHLETIARVGYLKDDAKTVSLKYREGAPLNLSETCVVDPSYFSETKKEPMNLTQETFCLKDAHLLVQHLSEYVSQNVII